MKVLSVTAKQLKGAGRWDIDYHLPPLGIKSYAPETLMPVAKCADIIKTKRDPTKKPAESFLYVDIASIDVETGTITQPQELTGEEAPSRARKVIHAYDIIISTCRPTRGAIAVVPEHLHGQICSTGFSVIRAKDGTNPFYLHFALRLASTLEQLRKWATGSSYPAILDEDVAKTLIPLPKSGVQDDIAKTIRVGLLQRDRAIQAANEAWQKALAGVAAALEKSQKLPDLAADGQMIYSIEQVRAKIAALPAVEEEAIDADDDILGASLFAGEEGGNGEE